MASPRAGSNVTPSPSRLLPKPGQQRKPRAAPPKRTAGSAAAAAVRASVADVVVVTQDAEAAAAAEWKARHEQVLAANEELHAQLRAVEHAHRKALTTVKYERTLPNNDVFTKQLVEENRELLARTRELELRLYDVDGRPHSTTSTPTSTKRSAKRSATATTRLLSVRTRVEHRGVQTDTDAVADAEQSNADAPSQSAIRSTQSQSPAIAGLMRDLKTRLSDLELNLERLRQENELLRHDSVRQHDSENQSVNTDEPHQQQTSKPELSYTDKREYDALKRSLALRLQQTRLLEARFAQLETRMHSTAALYDESCTCITQLRAELTIAQQQVTTQQLAIDAHSDLARENESLRSAAQLLRTENAALHDAVATLSARPFDSLSTELQRKNLWIAQLEDAAVVRGRELEQAQQDCRVANQTSAALRKRIHTLQLEGDQTAQTLAKCRLECECLSMANDIAALQLRYYTAPDDKELLVALGKALKDLRAQDTAAAKLTDFMEAVPRADVARTSQRSATAADANPLTQQRLEKVAELTALLQEDAQAQLAAATHAHAQEMHVLRRKLRQIEQRAALYLEQVRALQREKSEWLQRHSLTVDRVAALDDISSSGSCEGALMAVADATSDDVDTSSAGNAGREHDPTNIIEIAMSELRFTALPSSSSSSSSFVVLCDYYDFESQASPVATSVVASTDSQTAVVTVSLDFAITYKTREDATFFRSPASRAVHIEVHRLCIGCTQLVAVADVDLNALFLSRAGRCTATLALREPHTRVRIGSVEVEQTLAHPVDAFYRSVLRASSRIAHTPTSIAVAAHAQATRLQTNAADSGCVTIRVLALLLMKTFVSNVTAAAKRPNARQLDVAYRFIGFPRVAIALDVPRFASAGGYFVVPTEGARAFEVDASAAFARFLSTYTLELELRSTDDATTADNSPVVHGAALVSIRDALAQIATARGSSTSGFVFASIVEPSSSGNSSSSRLEPRLLGRVCVEIATRGIGESATSRPQQQFLPVTAASVLELLQSLFASRSLQTVPRESVSMDWGKFRDVMELSPLERALRELLRMKRTASSKTLRHVARVLESASGTCGSGISSTAATAASLFDSIEALGSLLRDVGGVWLSALDLAILVSGLRHASSSTIRSDSDDSCSHHEGSEGPRMRRILALLCDTSDDKWLEVEESLRHRVQSLRSLDVDAATSSETTSRDDSTASERLTIPWTEFLHRLGLSA